MLQENIEDMDMAVERLAEMEDALSEVLNDELIGRISQVISEWNNHLRADAEDAAVQIEQLESDLDDSRHECDELSNEVDRLQGEIESLEEAQ